MNKLFVIFLSSVAVVSMAPSAQAAQNDHKGLYFGVGFGKTSYEEDDWTTGDTDDIRSDDKSWKILAGYQFSSRWKLEASYTSYGTIERIDRYKFEPTALALTANLGHRFSNGIRPFALVGLSALNLSQSQPILEDDSGVAIRFGIGAEYVVSQLDDLTVRIAYEGDGFNVENRRFKDVESDVFLGTYYIGAAYYFK
ncbi:porin family protein [Photobacterium sanctipauli]|uniref:Porin family protein n=2 Tax=Photobacterium sanctipauli TaxID=1342794 RepID=A0A2T3NNW0_9GAMM|nr:porin family protein [Photobacterium sanctipauli]PSW17610.1 porin family protein [Photobacterium sanctipauli]